MVSTHNDGFVFHQAAEAETSTNSKTYPENNEFDHHTNQLFREMASLKGPDHTEVAFELIHNNDSAQMTSTQMNQVIHIDHALFH